MDVAGDNQLNVEHEMIKQRLTKDGKPIGKAGIEIIGEVNTTISYHLCTSINALAVMLKILCCL